MDNKVLGDIFNINNGKIFTINNNGVNILYNGGKKTYKTNGISNLDPNKSYIVIHKQNGLVSWIEKGKNICVGNNAFILDNKGDNKYILKYFYYIFVAIPNIIICHLHGSVQPTLKKTDIYNIGIRDVN